MSLKLNSLIVFLCKSIGQRRIYFADHPIIQETCRNFITDLHSFLAATGKKKLTIGIAENKIVYKGHYLIGPSIMGLQLVEFSKSIHCAGFVFDADVTLREVQKLLELTDHHAHPVNNLQESREFLKLHRIDKIHLEAQCSAPPSKKSKGDRKGQDQETEESGRNTQHSPLAVCQALFDVVAKSYAYVSLNRSMDINSARSVSEHLLNVTRTSFTDMLQFVQYPDHDSYTVGHSVRAAILAVFVGERLGFANEHLIELGTAALLHDVGKGKIPSEIIYKMGKLTREEFELMRAHPAIGAEILLEHKEATRMQITAAWGHHIRYDGRGYPEVPSWAVRSHVTSLLQICDVFEALTAVRPYKPSITPLSAFGIMVNDKGAFDPALLFAFISALGIYPPGNQVRLNNGCLGMVVASSSEIDKPVVCITHDQAGDAIDECDQQVIDLSKEAGKEVTVAELLI